MTQKKLIKLIKRHFARSENMHFYSVQIQGWNFEVSSVDEEDVETGSYYVGGLNSCDILLRSPLPKDDFEELAKAKRSDDNFWIKSVLLDDGEVVNYVFGGI